MADKLSLWQTEAVKIGESLVRYASESRTGSVTIRVNFNKGGITAINKLEEMTVTGS